MAFALLTVGSMMVWAAILNTQDRFVCLVQNDFTGKNNFTYWVLALLIFGAVGNVEKLKPLSDSLLFLIILALFLSHKGFFDQFTAAIGNVSGGTTGSTGTSGSW